MSASILSAVDCPLKISWMPDNMVCCTFELGQSWSMNGTVRLELMYVESSDSDGSRLNPVPGSDGSPPCLVTKRFMPWGDMTKLTNFSARALFLLLTLTP